MKLYEVYINLSYVNNLYFIINKYLISMNIKRLFLLYLYTIQYFLIYEILPSHFQLVLNFSI